MTDAVRAVYDHATYVHIIYRAVKHPDIVDAKEVVGVVATGYEDTVKVMSKLRGADVGASWNDYWCQSVELLTPANRFALANPPNDC